ncbi:ABC transporter permease subunit [Alcaligenes phenolicus]|nr:MULTISPECIES: ABC transporter permease subunit [Alcaligenes]OQV31282.1 amino acid ABC transporter permease [Alcaligenes phenolicus]UTM02466.1 ABC transporter permease subunit [Alcaligenes sp. NLF5-7]HRO20046.1 ABC transporter permease subunit [Alcaligenes phenolicus]
MTFEWDAIWGALPSLLEGTKMTLLITLLGLVGGAILGFLTGVITTYIRVPVTWRRAALFVLGVFALGFALKGLSWLMSNWLSFVPAWIWSSIQALIALSLLGFFRRYLLYVLSFLCQLYVLFIRGTPIVVQVMFIYFALPMLASIRIDGLTAAIFTLMINSGAYISEIVRGALQSVPKGLKEAGEAMGLPFHKILRHIIGPVAFRRMIPAMGNQCIISLKDSSLFIVIGVAELTRQGQEIIANNFRSVEIWGAVAVIYLILTSLIALTLKFIEHRMRIV